MKKKSTKASKATDPFRQYGEYWFVSQAPSAGRPGDVKLKLVCTGEYKMARSKVIGRHQTAP